MAVACLCLDANLALTACLPPCLPACPSAACPLPRLQMGVTDVQISLTTLDEVFLRIARQAELEAAAAEGRTLVTAELEDGGSLQVQLGEEFATDPATGRHYNIRWAQDDSGTLQVLKAVEVDSLPASHAANGGGSGAHGILPTAAVAPTGAGYASPGTGSGPGSSAGEAPPTVEMVRKEV